MKNQINIEEILKIIDGIEGWLSHYEQFALLHLPGLVDHIEGDIVEIGSYKGKSTVALGIGSQLMSKQKKLIYTIDPFNKYYDEHYYQDFLNNLKSNNLEKYVIPIKKLSTEAYNECPKEIAALFIDGDHEYSSVQHDINHYASRVLSGGIIAFHDYIHHWPGVQKAIDEFYNNGDYEYIGLYYSLLLLRKK